MISAARALFVLLAFVTLPGGSFAAAQKSDHTENSPKPHIAQCNADGDRRGGMATGEQGCDERDPKCGRDLRCGIGHHEECTESREGCAEDREAFCEMRKAIEERRCDRPAREFGRGCDAARSEDETNIASGVATNPNLKIGQFVLYAERTLSLGECGAVGRGDLGVRSLAQGSQGSQLKIGRDSFVQPSHIVLSPSVLVGQGVTLGAVGANQFRDDDVSLGPTTPFPAAAMPPLPLAQVGASTGPDVSVARDQAVALLPGHFGALKVDGVLLLNPGSYVAEKVLIGDFARIVRSPAMCR